LIWITGLPAAGKTTLAGHIQTALRARNVPVVVLDGDDLRRTVNADLGFSEDARRENVRRIGEIARVLLTQGFTVIVACISPFRAQRDALRATFAPGQFVEVFVDTPLEVCQARDPKGLYRRAATGALREMTGVDAGYEAPFNPHFVFKPDSFDAEALFSRLQF
jgi:adenylyl-sulfate kinase